ncbi:hypothetical protein LINGRAHAP2_LOCUS24894 [Linum grandiflorum]
MFFEVSHFGWAIMSVLGWILFFMLPMEDLFLYVPAGYGCIIIFYIVLITAALSLTYATYKIGEGVEAGTYRLGCLAKFVNFSAFALIAVMAAQGNDDQQTYYRTSLGLVGFMWEFHCLLKLGWNLLDYTFPEMFFTDAICIISLFGASRPDLDAYIVIGTCLFVFALTGAMKFFLLHLKNCDTIEDRHCVMCDRAMQYYPERVVELLEGSV